MESIFQKNGRPFFALGGQAHNSTTYSAHDLSVFWRALDTLHANTAEIPVYWEAIEPQEGKFDFSSVDLLLRQAREHKKQLVLLWFGTWKNGNMRYVPAWVKQNTARFRRVTSHEGNTLFVLSSHCRENLEADKRAFCALMSHLRKNNTDGILSAVQVENEAGIAGRSYRDFGPEGQQDYLSPVPEGLLDALAASPSCPLYRQWEQQGLLRGKSWGDTFGVKNGAENLTAYSVASYIGEIARAGKEIYSLPLYVNAALDGNPWGWNLAGTNYTAGGPFDRMFEIWKFAAPHLDLLAPDIYFDCTSVYTHICDRYNTPDNALFIPESSVRPGGNPKNMFYAAGTYGAIGVAAFGVEDVLDEAGNPKPEAAELIGSYHSLSCALPLLTKFRGTGKVRTVVQEEFEGGFFYEAERYLVKVDYARGGSTNFIHRAKNAAPSRPRGLIIEAGPEEFYVLGSDFTVTFSPKDDIFYSEDRVTNHMPYLFVEEGHFDEAERWATDRTRTGDECDHGLWVFPENGVVHTVLCP